MKNVGWKVSINCLIYAHKQTKTLSGGIFNSPVWLLSEEKGEEGRKSMEYVLELKNIYKSFPGVKVLEDVTLQVRPQCGQLKPRTLIFQYFWAYILHFFTKIS